MKFFLTTNDFNFDGSPDFENSSFEKFQLIFQRNQILHLSRVVAFSVAFHNNFARRGAASMQVFDRLVIGDLSVVGKGKIESFKINISTLSCEDA